MRQTPTSKEKPLLPRKNPKQISFDTPQAKAKQKAREMKKVSESLKEFIMTKSTWNVSTGTHELLGDALCVSTQEGDVDVICIVSAGERTTEADLGNARLIASAPDLLEALETTKCLVHIDSVAFECAKQALKDTEDLI